MGEVHPLGHLHVRILRVGTLRISFMHGNAI